MKTLILYSSRDGQTKKIADTLAQHLGEPAVVAELHEKSAVDFRDVSQIVIGASIRYGHFKRSLYAFVKKYENELNQLPSAFFSVNLTARKADKNSPETNVYTRKFLQRVNWKPHKVQVFAGALYYPRYHFFDRIMIQFIMRLTGGETDTHKEVEYTDWQQVQQFAEMLKDQAKSGEKI